MLKSALYKRGPSNLKRQAGVALLEALIAGVVGLIAAGGMLMLMANTFSSSTKTIRMAGLSKEMRAAMQIMTRELRRANYHDTFAACFGDGNCIDNLGISGVIKDISINGGSGGSCFWFWYDRPQGGSTPIGVTNEQVAAFRLTTNADGVGSLEMSINRTTAPNCSDDNANWQAITDPEIFDITSFAVSNTGSFSSPVTGSGTALSVNRIGIAMTGSLVNDPSLPAWMGGTGTPTVQLEDFVRVRNDIPTTPGP